MAVWKRTRWILAALLALILGQHVALKAMRADPAAKAEALGFVSVDEMAELIGRGYESKAAYLDVKSRSAGQFSRECRSANSKEYRARCQGQRISWTGLLVQHDGSTARVAVMNDDGTALAKPFSIDSKSLAKAIGPEKVGRMVTFDGEIARQNPLAHDIEHVTLVATESDAALATRRVRRAVIAAEASPRRD